MPRADRVRGGIVVHPFLFEVEEVLAAEGLIPDGAALVIAVSGGMDSMLLLRALSALRARHAWRLGAAHFHHQLRGDAADADQQLVERVSGDWGIPVLCGSADVRVEAKPGESPEAAARRMRHAFLAEAARRFGAFGVALGHHADDQVEWFLLRLLRGAGGAGLGGMAVNAPSPADPGLRLIRPWLTIPRSRLRAAAEELGVPWREDASNHDRSVPRNRVRHELVPLLADRYQPALGDVLRRVQTLLRDQAKAVEDLARGFLERSGSSSWGGQSVAVQREVIRLQLLGLGIEPDFARIETLRGRPGLPLQVSPTQRVTCSGEGRVSLVAVTRELEPHGLEACVLSLAEGRGEVSFGGGTLQWQVVEAAAGAGGRDPISGVGEQFDAERIGSVVTLRHWRPGDRFRPIGMAVTVKLQDLFTNARIPADQRRRLVLAESGDGEVFWVERLRIGDGARLTERTRRRLIWKWRR